MALKVAIILVLFVSVYFLLKLLSLSVQYIVQKRSHLKNILKAKPVAEFIIWLFTFFFSIQYLFGNRYYFAYFSALILVIMIVFISWFWLKDWIAGVFFRTLHNYQKGEFIQLSKYQGHVQHMGSTHISIDTPEGKTLKIPYSQLMNAPVSEHFEVTGSGNAAFTMKVSKEKDEQMLVHKIQQVTQTSPWHIPAKIPIVKVKERNKSDLIIEVVAHTRNKEHAFYLEELIRNNFEK